MTKRTNPFRGMGVALVTPFTADGRVDFDALSRLIDLHINEGTDFLCILGTTAETPCLTIEEKNTVTRFAVDQIAGRMPILLGAGGNCTAEVVHHLNSSDLSGIDGVLIVAPYYNKPSQDGLYRHFSAVAEATELPVVLYNVPGRTGVNIEAETTLRIAREHENVVAIKEASGRFTQIEDIVREAPEGFEVLSGDDGITFELLTLGATGVISVIGNAYPRLFSRMVHAAIEGDFTSSLLLHRRMSELFRLLSVDGNPSGIKGLLSVMGHIENVLRLPLVPAREATLARLEEIVRQETF